MDSRERFRRFRCVRVVSRALGACLLEGMFEEEREESGVSKKEGKKGLRRRFRLLVKRVVG